MKATQFIQKRYPHMLEGEATIWTRFLEQTDLEFDKIIYDLHLGEGQPFKPGEPPFMKDLRLAVTRKRVDAVGETESDIWIFEVKPRVSMSALGQLVTYFELYHAEYSPIKPVMLAAIGESQAPDIRPTFDLYAVNIIIV